MTLTGCFPDRTSRYFAVWRVDANRCIHDKLPKFIQNEPDAWAYALDNRPSWGGSTLPSMTAEGGDVDV